MATRFEIVLHGTDPVSLRAAAEEALYEIQRLEAQLNLYSETSEISGINARAAQTPIKVEPGLFHLLKWARALSLETAGAFDITVAPLMKCWGFMKNTGHVPHPADLAAAQALVGMNNLILNEQEFTIRFERPGVMVDLGAIGKGYAIELAAEVLREGGVTSALLHGGTSTIYAIGTPPGEDAWKVAIAFPDDDHADAPKHSLAQSPSPNQGAILWEIPQNPNARNILSVVPLRDEALSVSAVWGKAFQSGEKMLGHVIDPRTGEPATRAMLAAVVLPSATETDAFSTALLIGGREAQGSLNQSRPGMRSVVAGNEPCSGQRWTSCWGFTESLR